MAKSGYVKPEYTLEQARVIISKLMEVTNDASRADSITKGVARRALEITLVEVGAAEADQTDLRKRTAK